MDDKKRLKILCMLEESLGGECGEVCPQEMEEDINVDEGKDEHCEWSCVDCMNMFDSLCDLRFYTYDGEHVIGYTCPCHAAEDPDCSLTGDAVMARLRECIEELEKEVNG